MLEKLEKIREEGFQRIAEAADMDSLELVRRELTGKKSALQEVLKSLGSLDADMRKTVGMKANEVKNLFAEQVKAKEEMLIAGIAKGLLEHAASPESKEYMAAYRKRFMLDGESVDLFRGGEPMGSGRVVGVDDDGGLLFIPDGKSEMIAVRSGEVSVRKIKKEEG